MKTLMEVAMVTLRPIYKLIQRTKKNVDRALQKQLRAIDQTRDRRLKAAKSKAEKEIIRSNAEYEKEALLERMYAAKARVREQKAKTKMMRQRAGIYTPEERLGLSLRKLSDEATRVYSVLAGKQVRRTRVVRQAKRKSARSQVI